MKTFIALSLLLLAAPVHAKQLSYDALPPAIKRAIDSEDFDRDKVTAEQEVKDGRVVYKVGIRQFGRNPEIWIASDGKVIKDSRNGRADGTSKKAQNEIQAALGKGRKLRIGDTPVAVQNALKAEIGPINSVPGKNSQVTVSERDGRKVYHIEYKGRAGRSERVVINEAGTILESDRPVASSQKRSVTQPGERFVQLKDIPVEARKTVQREAKSGEVSSIELESVEARNIFKVELRQGAQTRFIWVEADGRILKQTEAAGAGEK